MSGRQRSRTASPSPKRPRLSSPAPFEDAPPRASTSVATRDASAGPRQSPSGLDAVDLTEEDDDSEDDGRDEEEPTTEEDEVPLLELARLARGAGGRARAEASGSGVASGSGSGLGAGGSGAAVSGSGARGSDVVTGWGEGVFMMDDSIDVEGYDTDAEPDTEDDDIEVQLRPLARPPTASSSRRPLAGPSNSLEIIEGIGEVTSRGSTARNPTPPELSSTHRTSLSPASARNSTKRPRFPNSLTPVLDLTSSASASDSENAPFASGSTSRSQDKGKGKARAISLPPTPPPASLPPAPSLSTLSCPICLGAPTPLALTSCGHTFCAPCLHAALIAGPPLTPPPQPLLAAARGGWGGRGRGAGVGRGSGGVGRGSGGVLFHASGRGRGGGYGGAAGYGFGVPEEEEESEGGELDKHCPVCRAHLKGGWGKSLRGLVLRMAPVKKRPAEQVVVE